MYTAAMYRPPSAPYPSLTSYLRGVLALAIVYDYASYAMKVSLPIPYRLPRAVLTSSYAFMPSRCTCSFLIPYPRAVRTRLPVYAIKV